MPDIKQLTELTKTLLPIYGTIASVILAVLVLFWQNERLQGYKRGLVGSFCFVLFANVLALTGFIATSFTSMSLLITVLVLISVFCCIFGLLLLGFTFAKSHLTISALRVRRFKSYILPRILLKRFSIKLYAKRMQLRQDIDFFQLPINSNDKKIIASGYSILLVMDGISEERAKRTLFRFLLDGLVKGETLDYVCTDRHPFIIKDEIYKYAVSYNFDLSKLAKDDIVIIDAFSPIYGFKEDILLSKDELTKTEMHIIKAGSIAGIHSAAIDAWYLHKMRLKKSTGKELRRPHRMVYDHLSVLRANYGVEQILEFLTHLISSEKAYGMITIIVEYDDSPKEILNLLEQLVDCSFHSTYDENKSEYFLNVRKMRHISMSLKNLKIEI